MNLKISGLNTHDAQWVITSETVAAINALLVLCRAYNIDFGEITKEAANTIINHVVSMPEFIITQPENVETAKAILRGYEDDSNTE